MDAFLAFELLGPNPDVGCFHWVGSCLQTVYNHYGNLSSRLSRPTLGSTQSSTSPRRKQPERKRGIISVWGSEMSIRGLAVLGAIAVFSVTARPGWSQESQDRKSTR